MGHTGDDYSTDETLNAASYPLSDNAPRDTALDDAARNLCTALLHRAA